MAIGVYLLFNFAAYVAAGTPAHALLVGSLGLIPLAIYATLRWPIYFPFSLYAILVPVEALLRTGGNSGATVTKLVSFAVGAAFLTRIVLVRRAVVPPRAWFAWGAFTLFALASLGWSVLPAETTVTVEMLLQLFLLYTLAAIYPIPPIDVIRLRRVIEIAAVVLAVYGVYAYFTGQREVGTRLSLSTGDLHIDPNHYGAAFILAMSLLAARFLTDRRIAVRLATTAALTLCALNLFFTGSRGVFVGIARAFVYLAIRSRKYLATATIAGVFLAISFVVPNVWQRFNDPTQGDASGRTDIWTVGLHAFPHYWLAGSGFSTYDYVYNIYLLQSFQRQFQGWSRPSHNLIVGTSVELGIVGLALVLIAWFMSVRETWKVHSDHPLAPIAYGAEAACLGLFVAALSVDMLWFKYLWLALMVSAMTANGLGARTLWALRAPTPKAVELPAL